MALWAMSDRTIALQGRNFSYLDTREAPERGFHSYEAQEGASNESAPRHSPIATARRTARPCAVRG